MITGHQCMPSRLAGRRAHGAPRRTRATCPCGKQWEATRNHFTGPDGRRGAICGCGWQLIQSQAQEAAA